MMTISMDFYVAKCNDGTLHVQNVVMGRQGQHHVHNTETFQSWLKNVDPEHVHYHDLEKCACGLDVGDVREHDGRVWHNDRFQKDNP